MDSLIASYDFIQIKDLRVCEKQGIAYQEDMSKTIEYGKEYYDKYLGYEENEISKAITAGRVELTERYCWSRVFLGCFTNNAKVSRDCCTRKW